ncbi:MBL fold metallo-hydrolase [Corallococcus exercitus]|uniref:MBL fold metallo-hydrolase n=1 Tax=Corallococcus exercitus TaxID=2316736 RepID=A0A7Y4JR89_9BACT|nr:MBL fold metallo-hydrolase [Corallococcus exercitus]
MREFLEELKVTQKGNPIRIRFVCLTHPHDDHYAGLGRLLEAFLGGVDAVWSVPKVGDRYTKALMTYAEATRAGREPLPDDVEFNGLERVLGALNRAQRNGAKVKHVSQGKDLLRFSTSSGDLVVMGCGPADEDVENALPALLQGVENLIENGSHDARFDPNATSGALLLRWGKAGILLGGDLLCASGFYKGWNEVFGDIHPPVQVIKTSHHASEEAHHEELWQRLGAHLAIVTPFKSAEGSMPPRPERISRLAQKAVVAITATPAWRTAKGNPSPIFTSLGKSKSSGVTSARNGVLKLSPKPSGADIHNAIAVSLNASGKIVRLVFGGKANVYEPPVP